jgi:hypothetical protein
MKFSIVFLFVIFLLIGVAYAQITEQAAQGQEQELLITKKKETHFRLQPNVPSLTTPKEKITLPKSVHKNNLTQKHKKIKSATNTKQRKHYGKKRSPKGNFIELDWMMVGIVAGVAIALIVLLWLLIRATELTLFGLIFFALGFALTIFFWMLANTENDADTAAYEYFLKFGIFAWVGLLLLIAGLLALFGGMPNVGTFLLIGLILGGVSLLISILKGNSILNELFPYWIK